MISNPRHGSPPRLMAHQPTRRSTTQESSIRVHRPDPVSSVIYRGSIGPLRSPEGPACGRVTVVGSPCQALFRAGALSGSPLCGGTPETLKGEPGDSGNLKIAREKSCRSQLNLANSG